MSDAALFAVIFIGFFILRIIAATVFFLWLLPQGDRCPMCDTPTVRVVSRGWNTLMPWFRTSWCYECNWEGLLRHGPLSPKPELREAEKQAPAR
ncbi:MAG TPA: hypothetical protein VJ812_01035 [Gemmatimonadaceae bacterium]|jgi:hypothetical protein|nr:hypothetical protein [Gemmatimonadaceae bacterium]